MTEISIKGTVTDNEDEPLAGAQVIAVNEAERTSVTRTTDDTGSYSFEKIESGTWKLSVKKQGYKETWLTASRFDSDQEGLDFRLVPAIKVEGTLFRYGSESNIRIPWATVVATAAGQKTQFTKADEDGDYRFSGLVPGHWTFTAMEENSRPGKKSSELKSGEERHVINFELYQTQGNSDAEMGKKFFIGLIVGLLILVIVWLLLHWFVPHPLEPTSKTLPILISRALTLVNESTSLSNDTDVVSAVTAIEGNLENFLEANSEFSDSDKEAFTKLREAISAAVKNDNQSEAISNIEALDELLQPRRISRFSLWSQEPWRYLEVLLWGLAGVLVQEIIIIGTYLRWNRFYGEGIWMHLAHLVTAPLLVLVTVLLLSLVTISLVLTGGSSLIIDLSDPRIMVAVAFLLGSSPWNVWSFLQMTADKITGTISGDQSQGDGGE